MRVFDGRETLEFERTGEELRVLLTGNQIRMASMDVIRQHASIDDETPEEYQAAITYAVAAPGLVRGEDAGRKAGAGAEAFVREGSREQIPRAVPAPRQRLPQRRGSLSCAFRARRHARTDGVRR